MKKLISALLCLALLVSCAPVLAFAASEGVTVSNMDELTAAIEAAEPGDTVVLAAGEYAPEGGVLTIDKAVNLRGSIPAGGAGYTEFNGAIVYDLAGDARGYRVDVQRQCDVVEDILRVYGYNNVEIPSAVRSTLNVKGDEDKSHKLQNLVAEQLVGCGFNEILNNSLQRAAYYDGMESYPASHLVKLMNPLSSDLNAMRQTLLFGGLECIAHNANRKNADLKFFEFGNCYYFREENKCPDIVPGVSSSRDPEVIQHVLDAYSEDYHLGLWVTGKRVSGSWAHPDEDSSFYELKAYVLNILTRLGMNFGALVFAPSRNDIYSKGIEIQNRGGKVLAMLGIVSRKIQKMMDVDHEVYYADLNWKLLMKAIRNNKISYTEIGKFPAVSRDLALLLDKGVEFAEIEKVAYSTEKKLLKEVTLFDVYEGKNLEAGKKSYAVNFVLQDETKTLNDKQIDAIMNKLIANLQAKLGAKLR